jgi:hypothetical protein
MVAIAQQRTRSKAGLDADVEIAAGPQQSEQAAQEFLLKLLRVALAPETGVLEYPIQGDQIE